MRLRKLEMKDAPHMLEWMHDASVVQYMDADFLSKIITDCERFRKEAMGKGGSKESGFLEMHFR